MPINSEVNDPHYVREIPKGYRYCSDCHLITPYVDIDDYKWKCDICDNVTYWGESCDNCGYEHDFDKECIPETINVKQHYLDCPVVKDPKCLRCDCPEVKAYTVNPIFNYRSWDAHWQTECSNAKEWYYEVVCPICFNVFEVEGGNC